MLKNLLLMCVTVLLSMQVQANIIYIDCAGNGPAGWNGRNFATLGSVDLIYTNSEATGYSLEITERITGTGSAGTSTPIGDAAEFAPAGTGYAYGQTGRVGRGTFSGLSISNMYTFTFYASRMDASENREALYSLAGGNSGSNTLNPTDNTNKVTIVSNIYANADGTLDLTVNYGPNNASGNKYYYITAMRIDTVDELPPPVIPTLVEPSEAEIVIDTNLVFKLSSINRLGGALQYKIEVSENSDFSTIDYTYDQTVVQTGWTNQNASGSTAYTSGSTSEYHVVSTLPRGNIYYWRAYAYNLDWDDNQWSEASEIKSFYIPTDPIAPDAPTLIYPTNGASVVSIPHFSLSAIDSNLDDIQYKVEVSPNSGFTGTVYTYDQNEVQAGWMGQDADSGMAYASGSIAKLYTQRSLAEGTYYWRAIAIDVDGTDTWGPYSETNSFSLTAVAPVYIDCYGENAPTETWNNFNFNQANDTTASLKNTNGVSSGISIKIVTRFSSSTTGTLTASGAAAEFAPAGNGATYHQSTLTKYDFSGFNIYIPYTFSFFGSRGTTDTRETTYMVVGENSATNYMNVGNNSTNVVVLADIQSTTGGVVRLNIDDGPVGNSYMYINAMKVTFADGSVGMPDAPTLIAPTNGIVFYEGQPFEFSVTDSQGDYVVGKIEVSDDVDFTNIINTFDQSISQAGWTGQNIHGDTAYTSGSTASYTLATAFNPGHTYYWRAYAMDPAGSGEWGSVSETGVFNTISTGTWFLIK